jgi:peptidyl-tRNA hydrolase, PTH1 family
MPKLIVGLGNPGARYAGTRHNAGFMCVERLAGRAGLTFRGGRANAALASGQVAGQAVVLAKPRTFMNDSGVSVGALVRFYGVAPDDLLIVCDDLDLPFGRLRLRPSGSAGGQRGLASILQHLQRTDVPRLRIGIGRPPGRMASESYVLLPFAAEERERLPEVIDAAADAAETWLREGLTLAMTRHNGWALPGAEPGS